MENKRYSIEDVSDIQFRMQCGIRAVRAVHELLEGGNNEPEDYVDALYGVYDYLERLNDELREVVDGMTVVTDLLEDESGVRQ